VWSQLTRGIDRKIAKNSRFYLKAPVPHTHTHTHTHKQKLRMQIDFSLKKIYVNA
jgi:hypothetical protein